MESITFYLLKSASWLAGFTLVYLLFLRKERFFRLKRAYLVAGIVMSLLLPLITVHYRVELPAPVSQEAQFGSMSPAVVSPASAEVFEQKSPLNLFLIVYVCGMILFLFRTLYHFLSLYHAFSRGSVTRTGDAVMVKTEKYTSAFSFFNYVFINPSVSEQEAREILNHELVHLRQKHWFDLLLVEMMSLIQWMNPFVWIYSALVRQNHENLADEEALQSTSDPAGYRAALLNQVFNARLISLSNSFNFSFYTNRFEMMKKKTYSPYRKLKLLLVLPVAAVLLFAFASPRYIYADTAPAELTIMQAEALTQVLVRGVVYREDGTPFPGVSVNVSGTTLMITTGSDGRFELSNVSTDALLILTHKGYMHQTIKPQFDKEMQVKMSPVPENDNRASVKPVSDRRPGDGKEIKEIFVVVEEMPRFPGGDQALFNHVYENVKYPPEAKAQGIQGSVILRFVITAEGKVADVTIVRGVHPLLDEEAVRVMNTVPDWTPGRQGGRPVDVWYSVPINFALK
jgi:TonB family protein